MMPKTIVHAALAAALAVNPALARAEELGGTTDAGIHREPLAPAQLRRRAWFQAELDKSEKALRSSPQSLKLLENNAELLVNMQRQKEAAAAAGKLTEIAPLSAEGYKIAAGIYARLDRRTEGLAMIERWLALSPEHFDADALAMRAGLRDPADFAGREADIAAILVRKPQHIGALFAKGSLEFDRGDFSAAAGTYSELSSRTGRIRAPISKVDGFGALATAPSRLERDPLTLNLLGFALYRSGNLGAADTTFKEARRTAGKAGYTLSSLCWGKVTFNIAPERALEECRSALTTMPDDPHVLDSRGMIYLRMGELANALADFDRALWQCPEQANSLFARAIIEATRGEVSKAKADAQAARELWPNADQSFRRWGYEIPEVIAPD